ncbi:hypothetical protein A1O3_01486 [Capronia epimyces CBS 606.96]|uniref:Uncharacterized protein n=1 Tax=Capronia epimyces CBS 606.96 TaxID=1182542 RepID=W9YTF5_9EURO|nr:uncharacterized protein A1O3_01486 [Capronia epimyces CBS 606.96]EXJ92930.1 hypothetical protein A1O3_01486 [Capronia epimyces CBS 606.96]
MPPTIHSMPEKRKFSFDVGDAALPASNEVCHSSSPRHCSPPTPSLKRPKIHIERTSRATKRQCKSWNPSVLKWLETDPSSIRTRIIDWVDIQKAPLPTNLSPAT